MTKGCDNCEYSGRPSYAYPCYVCIGKNKWEAKTKPKTNADYIRGMTDYEMTRELIPLFEELFEDGIPSPEWFKDWLQQPYKEE